MTAVGKNGENAVYSITAEKPKMSSIKVKSAGIVELDKMLSGVAYSGIDSVTSSKPSVAEITADGKISVKAKGTATITVIIGGKKYKAKLKAKI